MAWDVLHTSLAYRKNEFKKRLNREPLKNSSNSKMLNILLIWSMLKGVVSLHLNYNCVFSIISLMWNNNIKWASNKYIIILGDFNKCM